MKFCCPQHGNLHEGLICHPEKKRMLCYDPSNVLAETCKVERNVSNLPFLHAWVYQTGIVH